MSRGRFRALVAADRERLLAACGTGVGPDQLAARRDSLPEPVRRYLRFAIPESVPPIRTVHLRHNGFFRPNPGPRWFAIQGEQHFTLDPPGFVWHGRIRMLPLVWIEARDCLISGAGNMLVKLNSAFTLADARGPEMDQSAQARWLAEVVWFPPAFAGDRIVWKPAGDLSAHATLQTGGLPVSTTIDFDGAGRAVGVRGERYRAVSGGRAVLTPWSARCGDYRDFGAMRVPSSVEVAWNLPEGEFCYARFRVTELEYNPRLMSGGDSPTAPRADAG